jgi:hypothetical protein
LVNFAISEKLSKEKKNNNSTSSPQIFIFFFVEKKIDRKTTTNICDKIKHVHTKGSKFTKTEKQQPDVLFCHPQIDEG